MNHAVRISSVLLLALGGCSSSVPEREEASSPGPERDSGVVESLRCDHGTLTLAAANTYATPFQPVAVAIGRLGDGPARDLVWIDENGAVATARLDEPVAQLRVKAARAPLLAHAMADVDQDGRHDLVLVQEDNVRLLRGAATPDRSDVFAPVESFAVTSDPLRAAIVDVDGDGRVDIALDDGIRPQRLAGHADLRFTATQELSRTAASEAFLRATMGDFDGDGERDAIERSGPSQLRMTLDVGGAARRRVSIEVDIAVDAWTIADLDRDGHTDLVLAGDEGEVLAMSCASDGSCRTTTIGWTSGPATYLLAEDVNADGLPDIVAVAGARTEVLASSCACDEGWTGPQCQLCSESDCADVGGFSAAPQIVVPARLKRRVVDVAKRLIEAVDPTAVDSDLAVARMQAFVLALSDADLAAVATVESMHARPADDVRPEPFAEAELRVGDEVLRGDVGRRGSTLVLIATVPPGDPAYTGSEGQPPPPTGSPHLVTLDEGPNGRWHLAHPEAMWPVVDGAVRVGPMLVPLELVQRTLGGTQ